MTDAEKHAGFAKAPDLSPILHRISLLGGLTEQQLSEVVAHMESASYPKGSYIFRQGEEPSSIYVIRSGKVKMLVDVDGEIMELVEYDTGQCFGETSAIGILPHSASAYVTEDAELAALSRQALLALYHEDPKVFAMLILNIAREACRRLHKTDRIMLHYAAAKKR